MKAFVLMYRFMFLLGIATLLGCQATHETLPVLGEVPEFSLQAINGDTINKSALLGHVTAINFFFTSCPEVCPTVNGKLSILAQDLKANPKVQFLSVSIDPDTDSVEELKTYAERFKVSGTNWSLTRAPIDAVQKLAQALQIEAGEDKELHTTRVAIVDKGGRLRALINGVDQDAALKLRSIITDLAELE